MSIQKKQPPWKQGEKPPFFPFFQEVKSRAWRRDFFQGNGSEEREISTNSHC
jgi:hypothetical protein